MNNFKLYSVSDTYILYLREKFPNVYSNKTENRIHTRKYQVIFIRKNQEKIRKSAQILYKQKTENDTSANYVSAALDYKELEKMCDLYSKM